MRTQSNGYVTLVTCLLLPIVLLGLGLMTFSLLKTQHIGQMQTICRQQYYTYFSDIKIQLGTIAIFKSMAIGLYQTQIALLPMIWMPPALKLYRAILKFRKYLERIQNKTIEIFNLANRIGSLQAFAGIQRALDRENDRLKNTLQHTSLATFSTNPNLQIVKRMNILFPPYEPHPQIESRQRFLTAITNHIRPKTWIHFFSIDRLNENFECSATIVTKANQDIKISYSLQSRKP